MHALRAAALAASLLGVAVPAAAVPITFDFDAMGYRSQSSPGPNSAVETYMQGVWTGAGQTGDLSVTGAGQLSNNRYTGDGHVVGPVNCSQVRFGVCLRWNVEPLTLGNTEGATPGSSTPESPAPSGDHPDNYIVNSGSDRIVLTLPSLVYAVSFDFQIFPDGTCPSILLCGGDALSHLPDFQFLAGTSLAGLSAAMPTQYAVFPGEYGTYVHSPASGVAGSERAPQFLGVSGTIFFPEGVSVLAFVDWPQRIGIDNLVLDTECSTCVGRQVPEPASWSIAALALAMLALVRPRRLRRRRD